jgi:hypothetical protein
MVVFYQSLAFSVSKAPIDLVVSQIFTPIYKFAFL